MRYRLVILTGKLEDDEFQDLLRGVLLALTRFPQIAIRFDEYTPDQNGTS